MNNKLSWWIGLALVSGCRIESFGPCGASVRVVKDGMMLGCGQHGHVEDSVVHAVAQFVNGCGKPVREGCDHPDCRTGGISGMPSSTFNQRCKLADGSYEHGGLGNWMHPSERNPDARDYAFTVEHTGVDVRITLRVMRPSVAPEDEGEHFVYEKAGNGPDYPTALAAALASEESQTVVDWPEVDED